MTTLRVLVVEDDPIFAKLLQMQLRTLEHPGCEVTREASLADAQRRLAAETFDAILTDLGLPDSQGADTVAALDDAGKGTPVIVLSGSDEAPPGRKFLRKGGIGPADLARILVEATGRSR